jgi:hypothetical protein
MDTANPIDLLLRLHPLDEFPENDTGLLARIPSATAPGEKLAPTGAIIGCGLPLFTHLPRACILGN